MENNKRFGTGNVQTLKKRGDTPKIVYDYLLNKIVSMRLSAGARIEERVIVEELGISRTPVRQAFMRMATEGLIELLPNRGARIPPLDIEEVRSLLESFEFLLLATGHLAAKRRTEFDLQLIEKQCQAYEDCGRLKDVKGMIETNEQFHLAVAKAGHNSHMERLVADLLTKVLRLDWFWYSRSVNLGLDEKITKSFEEHDQLYQAIRTRNLAEVERVTVEHVQSFRQPLIEYLGKSEAVAFGYSNAK